MSANNVAFVLKRKTKYQVYECCADEVSDSSDVLERHGCSLVDEYDDAEAAIIRGSELGTEYGVNFLANNPTGGK